MIKADASIHGEIRPAGVVSGSAQSGASVAVNKLKLTAEELAIATNKGWKVA